MHDTLMRRLEIETFGKTMVRRSIEETVNRRALGGHGSVDGSLHTSDLDLHDH